jgi:hypothetical protein
LSTSDNTYQYRQRQDDPTVIERRANKAGSRWGFYKVCDSVNDAKRALLAIGKGEGEEGK